MAQKTASRGTDIAGGMPCGAMTEMDLNDGLAFAASAARIQRGRFI
jgi:hypothetical protein